MAKTTAPLLSFSATGTIAKTQVYSKWKGRGYVRRHVIPANPNSTEQQKTRGVFTVANSIWKGAPSLFTDTWNLFATGQVLTGRNAFTSKYVTVERGLLDRLLMPFSPGAKGGLAPLTAVATPGAGQLSVAVTAPTPPTGWTLTSCIAACIRDNQPDVDTLTTITAAEDVTDPYACVLTGLTSAQLYVVGAWTKWAKPDGSVAYGASILTSATPT